MVSHRPYVSSDTTTVPASPLRRKIETNPAQPEYILTESGVGYRLMTGKQKGQVWLISLISQTWPFFSAFIKFFIALLVVYGTIKSLLFYGMDNISTEDLRNQKVYTFLITSKGN